MSLRDLLVRLRSAAYPSVGGVLNSAIIEADNNTLVAIGTNYPALLFLNESAADTFFLADIAPSDAIQTVQSQSPREYPEWTWDVNTRSFKPTTPDAITEDMRQNAVFAMQKMDAISRVIYKINRMRLKVNTGLMFQESIYAAKERQARALKDKNFDEELLTEVPYVSQYAEDNTLSLKQAAEEILLQAQLDRDHLMRTERLRMQAFKQIRHATSPEELKSIVLAVR